MGDVTIFREFRFEAAHRLPNVCHNHKCGRMHGHSYRVEVHVSAAELDPVQGWVCDFADIDYWWSARVPRLDHTTLNEIPGLENPTSENLARWIWRKLGDKPPLRLRAVVVHETDRGGCVYTGGSE